MAGIAFTAVAATVLWHTVEAFFEWLAGVCWWTDLGEGAVGSAGAGAECARVGIAHLNTGREVTEAVAIRGAGLAEECIFVKAGDAVVKYVARFTFEDYARCLRRNPLAIYCGRAFEFGHTAIATGTAIVHRQIVPFLILKIFVNKSIAFVVEAVACFGPWDDCRADPPSRTLTGAGAITTPELVLVDAWFRFHILVELAIAVIILTIADFVRSRFSGAIDPPLVAVTGLLAEAGADLVGHFAAPYLSGVVGSAVAGPVGRQALLRAGAVLLGFLAEITGGTWFHSTIPCTEAAPADT